ncbi:hypothetical protein C8C85_2369 [Flavobacterium sp. 103]|nr:hypothetical protein C8C85_2369 [Flavobacterium sp. 103]
MLSFAKFFSRKGAKTQRETKLNFVTLPICEINRNTINNIERFHAEFC